VAIVSWIVLTINPVILGNTQLPLMIVLALLGLVGTFLRMRSVVTLMYTVLLAVFIWGKAVGDLFHVQAPDTALFLLQFVSILFLYEITQISLSFESDFQPVKNRDDNFSVVARSDILKWYNKQFATIGKSTIASLGLSLGLVILGALLSVQVNQLAFAGILVIVSVVTLLLLLTYRREPQFTRRMS
jgi:hypothetical protein